MTDPPEGLDLADFKKWRKKNLKKFNVPDFGSVGVKQVRALPLENRRGTLRMPL